MHTDIQSKRKGLTIGTEFLPTNVPKDIRSSIQVVCCAAHSLCGGAIVPVPIQNEPVGGSTGPGGARVAIDLSAVT